MPEQRLRRNEQIRAYRIRLIDADGKQAGVVSVREGIEAAREVGLDLIEVAPEADPPVCRIMDWGRYRFEQKQREKEQRKKQKTGEVKALRLRPTTDDHDFQVTRRKAEAFLREGHKVRVEVRFRGREITHRELGQEILLKLAAAVGEVGEIEQQPSMDGRKMFLVIAPRPEVLKAAMAALKAKQAAEAAGQAPTAPSAAAGPTIVSTPAGEQLAAVAAALADEDEDEDEDEDDDLDDEDEDDAEDE